VDKVVRIDDYNNAFAIALDILQKANIHHTAKKSGAEVVESEGSFALKLPFIEREVNITMPQGDFNDHHSDREIPIQEKVLILHYLNSATGTKPSNDWITYREVPDGSFYYAAFVSRAVNPLKSVFGSKPDVFQKVAPMLKGEPIPEGDVAFLFTPLPLVPMKLIIWEGDDEFPAEGTILFDRTVSEHLSAEDIAWLSGMVVYRLMGLARSM
jgi:hypothetical protein